jgi:type I restriction enzyme S subunit
MEKLIPKLRFPEFKGEWEKKKLGEMATNKSGKYNPIKNNGHIKCVELEHIATETGMLLGYIDGSSSGSIKNKFDKGDVLFGKLRPYLKKYLQAPFEGVCSSEIWVLKGIIVSNEFLYSIVQTNKFIDLANQSSGSKMPRADWSVVENGMFTFPTLPEQTKIANFLTAVDEKLTALKQKKILLEHYKKGVMQQIFSQELRFKDENGNDFEDWEEKKLGEICKFFSGGTPTSTKKSYYSGEIPFIGSGNISDNNVNSFITIEALNNSSAKLIKKGDLLYALYGATSGEVSISKLDGAINQAVLCIRTNYNKFYLHQLLRFNKEKIVSTYIQGGQGNLSSKIVQELTFSFPTLAEQTKIANFLSSTDEKIGLCSVQIEKMGVWKKGLLQGMFV